MSSTPEAAPAQEPPPKRFAEVTADKNRAIAARDVAVNQVAGLQATIDAHATTIAARDTTIAGHAAIVEQHTSAVSGFTAEKVTWSETEALYQAGLSDPAAHAQARFDHGNTDGKTPLVDFVKACQADPTTAPRGLAGYLTATPAATPAPAPVVPTPTPTPAPVVPPTQPASGAIVPNGVAGSGPPTEAEWSAATTKMKAGDSSEYALLRKRDSSIRT
jgi:hypothetical protein